MNIVVNEVIQRVEMVPGPLSRTDYKLCLQRLVHVQVFVKQRENPAALHSLRAVITIITIKRVRD